ncbi:tRNA pseudouridine(38-40) synthase TruA [Terrilactibacillus sp. BCM23-1]|uniref:tRNA pseudouridine synthase A n=1 Tax=Terrilactibacillus tamarindi TaxID=2599694 RepID=A0A6N8CUH8_9BACI|nr:tRNA pseudouridine(38-40) synthase TruA [Terrilactibacillus tamarindi]MTT32735.1 tRNA pseudouridine(38-40) synthase TruA [Terrilactibacillus tamarindi]
MVKLKCTVTYDGTNFSGYQIQPNKRTVQGEIEAVLKKIHKGSEVKIVASGRTDAGVHAHEQVFHYTTNLTIPLANWKKALNSLLPDDIYIRKMEEVTEDFHARYHVKKKEYRYRLLVNTEKDVFRRNYTCHIPMALNKEAMEEAAKAFLGEHDFTSFCAANTPVVNKVRTIHKLSIIEDSNHEWVIQVIGSGFLYQMVRIIVGTLLDVGKGKLAPKDVADIIEKKDRSYASQTAPAQGLTMWKVTY